MTLVLTAALLVHFSAVAALMAASRGLRVLPLDLPSSRKDHPRAVPLAGPVLLLPLAGVLLLSPPPVGGWRLMLALGGLLAAAATGLADDLAKDRFPWGVKLAGQALAGLAGALALASPQPGLELALMMLWFLLVLNAVNFQDNTDGVAVSVILGVSCSLALLGPDPGRPAAAFLAGACLGFLPVNWPRARVFPGDCGSHSLGYCLAFLTLVLLAHGGPKFLLLPAALPLLDMAQVVAVRLWVGHRPWVADHRHLAHRLLAAGVKRPLVAPVFLAASVAALAPWIA